MAEKPRIYNFDFGNVQIEKDEVKITISKSQFTEQKKSVIDNVPTNNDEVFLNKQKINEDEENYTIIYEKTFHSLKPLIQIKNEEYPVKVSILQEILKQDILNQYKHEDVYIALNPATIFYYPMRTVKYTYAGNQFMPRTNHTFLERYKACSVSILSNIPYEKCLNTPDEVKKEGNDLIKEIYEKKSVQELYDLISESNNFITYNYISKRSEEKKKSKKQLYYTASILGLVAIAGIIVTQLISVNDQTQMAQAYETELAQKDTNIEANNAFQNGNYEEAIALYEETDVEASTVADKLIEAGQYQQAINLDNSKLETVIQTLYESNNQSQITELNADNLNEEASTKLDAEKAIVEGDNNGMTNALNFLNDENTAVRLAKKFAENNSVGDVQQIQQKYPDNETISQITSIVEEKQTLNDEIDSLTQQKNDTDNEDESNDLQNQIDDKNSQIDELNNQLNNL